MGLATPFRLGDAERAQILEFARRMRAVRRQAIALLVFVAIVGVQAYGPWILLPTLVLLPIYASLGRALARVRRVELPLVATLVTTQALIVVTLAVADRFRLDGLGLLVLPAAAACILLPRPFLVPSILWSAAVMVGAAFLIDPSRVMEEPPIVFLPLGVMLSVSLPAAMVRKLETASRDTATIDPLTGAHNRAAFEARVHQLTQHPPPGESRLGAIMADLDHFKRVNDEHGHDTGDRVLQDAVARLRSVLGPLTPIYRVGGEEFAIVIAGADEVALQTIAERLRQAVASAPLGGHDVTMSFGVGAARMADHPVTRVLQVADEALYRAKRAGRDRVAVANLTPMSVVGGGAVALDLEVDGAAQAGRVVRTHHDRTLVPTPRPAVALGHDHGNWLVRGDFERDHIRDCAHALSRTHHGALGFVALALLASIPWMGWKLMLPAIPAVIAYHATERRVRSLKRPEFALGGAWLLVQLAIFCGAIIADPGQPYMLILFCPLMIGLTAVFPTRGVQLYSGITALLCLVGGSIARPDLLFSYPALIGPPLLIISGIALMSSVTGRSAIEYRTRAVVDPLTGLLTRSALDACLATLREGAGSGTPAVSVVAFDIDHFKALNDGHGHDAGDRALRAVGEATRAHLAPLEWGFRVGGDEFVVVLPAGAERARALAERIRAAMGTIVVEGAHLSGSFGVATTIAGEAFSFSGLSRRADAALYEAKRAGRDRVAVAPAGIVAAPDAGGALREIA